MCKMSAFPLIGRCTRREAAGAARHQPHSVHSWRRCGHSGGEKSPRSQGLTYDPGSPALMHPLTHHRRGKVAPPVFDWSHLTALKMQKVFSLSTVHVSIIPGCSGTFEDLAMEKWWELTELASQMNQTKVASGNMSSLLSSARSSILKVL